MSQTKTLPLKVKIPEKKVIKNKERENMRDEKFFDISKARLNNDNPFDLSKLPDNNEISKKKIIITIIVIIIIFLIYLNYLKYNNNEKIIKNP